MQLVKEIRAVEKIMQRQDSETSHNRWKSKCIYIFLEEVVTMHLYVYVVITCVLLVGYYGKGFC